MPTKHTISQTKYDKVHRRNYGFKLHNEIDRDIIEKLASVPSMQGYIKQLIREDIARTYSENEKGENEMGNEFYNRVIRERIVDTKQYRYIAKECHNSDKQWIAIKRLPLKSIDTTDAIDGWETVKVIDL